MKRGDYKEFTFKHTGNVTASDISFVVKLTKSFSSPRLVQKQNDDTTEISTTYTSPYTYIKVKLLQSDTRDLTSLKYFYDIVADSTTIFDGELRINQDVQTPFDGTDPPTERFFVAGSFVTNANHGDLFSYDSTTHTIQPISKDSVWQFLSVSDTVAKILTDSLSKYGIKDNDETITGEWNFNKLTVDSLTIVTQDTTTIRLFNISTKTSSYTLSNYDDIILVNTGKNSVPITLPLSGIENGRVFTIKKIDSGSGNVVISVYGGGTIDGQSSLTIYYQNTSYRAVKNGNNYYIL